MLGTLHYENILLKCALAQDLVPFSFVFDLAPPPAAALASYWTIQGALFFLPKIQRATKIMHKPHTQTHLSSSHTHTLPAPYLDVILDAVLVFPQTLALGPALLHEHLLGPLTHLRPRHMINLAAQFRHLPLADELHACCKCLCCVCKWY